MKKKKTPIKKFNMVDNMATVTLVCQVCGNIVKLNTTTPEIYENKESYTCYLCRK